mmetsp:Transcript_17301/g.43714  ORF Transcript_17301/g.43714 Transcript_17301/m.43714 type:complete len:202 (-) Transcript_17301:144-749(-)
MVRDRVLVGVQPAPLEVVVDGRHNLDKVLKRARPLVQQLDLAVQRVLQAGIVGPKRQVVDHVARVDCPPIRKQLRQQHEVLRVQREVEVPRHLLRAQRPVDVAPLPKLPPDLVHPRLVAPFGHLLRYHGPRLLPLQVDPPLVHVVRDVELVLARDVHRVEGDEGAGEGEECHVKVDEKHATPCCVDLELVLCRRLHVHRGL